MALRARNTTLMRGVGQENTTTLKGKTANAGVTTRRAALGDITTNTIPQLPHNQNKDLTKKEAIVKPVPAKTISNLRDASIKSGKENATSKIAKPVQKAPISKPFASTRTFGLKKKDENKPFELVQEKPVVPAVLPVPAETKPENLEAAPLNYCDIDKDDLGKPFLVPEYTNDIYNYLRMLEVKYPVAQNFLAGQLVTPRMRSTLVDWLVDVQLQYHLLNETLHLCVAIIDMFLQKVTTISRDRLQLVGVGAMLVACKYEETYSPSVSDFVYITDNTFSKEEVLAMERYICGTLKFQLGRPSSLHFLRRYSKAAFATPLQHSISKYFLELALVDYKMVHVKPSLVAAAACFIALCVTEEGTAEKQSLWTDTLVKYSTYTFATLLPVVTAMANVILKSSISKLQGVSRKYAMSKMHKVSCLPALESETMKKLAGSA